MPNNIEIFQNAAGQITQIAVDGDFIKFVLDDNGSCVGYYDDSGQPVMVQEEKANSDNPEARKLVAELAEKTEKELEADNPCHTVVVKNEAGQIVKIAINGSVTEYVYNEAGECIGYLDDDGNPVIVPAEDDPEYNAAYEKHVALQEAEILEPSETVDWGDPVGNEVW